VRSRARHTPRTPRRSAYHHGNLREALIGAATALLEKEGPLGVTLRGAARRAAVSQTAPYRHFADKGALLAAIAEEGFRALARRLQTTAEAHPADPVRALEAMSVALVTFAADYPSHYRLMSGPAVRGSEHPGLRQAATAAWRVLLAAVAECQRAGRMRDGEPVRLAFVLWCLVHGLAVLIVDEQLPPELRRSVPIDRLAQYATQLLFEGFGRERGAAR
jgi:AcrR family transcriptional regulator